MLMFRSLCVDTESNLGRIDYASMSQQTLMELVIDAITNKEKICVSTDNPRDIAEWSGVTVDGNGDVTEIDASTSGLSGSFALEWLPSTIKVVNFSENQFFGGVNLHELPISLEKLNLSRNLLGGTLSLDSLPESLCDLFLATNAFRGTLNLTKLPEKMKSISVAFNWLSGSLDVTKLPPHLRALFVGTNSFIGETDFRFLPASLQHIDVSNNRGLSGQIIRRQGFLIGMMTITHNSKVIVVDPTKHE